MLELSYESVNFDPVSNRSDIFFDNANQKVCSVRAGGAMGVTARGPTSADVVAFRMADKGTIISMKLSPNLKTVAMQRTTSSVPTTHVLVVSSGILGLSLHPFVIKSGVINRLPKFDVDLGTVSKPPKLLLLDRDVTIATIYGKVYVLVLRHCPRVNAAGAEVLLYELGRSGSKRLLLSVLRDSFKKQCLTLPESARIFQWLTGAYAEHIREKTQSDSATESQASSPSLKLLLFPAPFQCVMLEQPDYYSMVFHPLVDDEEANKSYLVDVLLQYLLSLQKHEIPVQRLGNASEEIVEVLLSKHKVLQALRYIQTQGTIDRVNPLKFVEAAWLTKDRQLQYTVFKYFQDRNMKLKGTPAFSKGDRYERYLYDFKKLYDSKEIEEAAGSSVAAVIEGYRI